MVAMLNGEGGEDCVRISNVLNRESQVSVKKILTKKKRPCSEEQGALVSSGAEDETRTRTSFRSPPPQDGVSTNSTTPA